MATYAIDVDVVEIGSNVRDSVTLRFKSRAKTLPGLMAAAYVRYQTWLKESESYMPAHVPDFVPYRLTKRYDFDHDRFTYGCEPICDIFGQLIRPF